ncbi:glycosyltransferase [Hymenobacter canadensis]|uniref:Glycosyltransferase n=1 Tax=Hymenobacter canadensis TaxID=2999067 RepID=A0ABY7LMJ9_9BACT|nr:glycosyltransferase [Hymenobacter canadensis]WBA41673.1 glycosyltransferase [Hymenobacter canadensis]
MDSATVVLSSQASAQACATASLWQHLAPPAATLAVCVIIPAKDEASQFPETLAALAAQVDEHGQPLPPGSYEVLVLANNCHDRTAAVVRNFAYSHPLMVVQVAEVVLAAPEAHVGRARRLLMDEACRRLEQTAGSRGIIASTDADTRVAATWLAATQAEFAAGADAVGGRIYPEAVAGEVCVRRTHLRDARYRLLRARLEALLDPDPADMWPRHHQHFGASLALTVAAYRLVGGLPVVPYLEDEALWQALRSHDLRLRHSPKVCVSTSGRHQGRVEVGLSWQLREWASLLHQQREPYVESGASLAAEWQARRQLRQLWKETQAQSARVPHCVQLAAALSVPASGLARELAAVTSFGMLWEWVMQHRARWRRQRLVPLTQAILELRQLLERHEPGVASQVLPGAPRIR